MNDRNRLIRRQKAFTLIELLVVVGIIAALSAIMMPSLKEVRRLSRRTVCQKGLDQIGIGMHSYLVGNRDTYPYACRLPSFEQFEAQQDERTPLPSIPEVLKREIKGGKEVFCCPSDENTMSRAGEPGVALDEIIPTRRYYDNEGTSYEWEDRLNGEVVDFKLVRVYAKDENKKHELARVQKTQMWMMFDFESFHGGKTMRGSQNILYADLHVEADKWSDDKKVGRAMPALPTSMIPPRSY